MDGIIAFHGYQSFKPNEVIPSVAHEIGVKLADQLWGDRFKIVVATLIFPCIAYIVGQIDNFRL